MELELGQLPLALPLVVAAVQLVVVAVQLVVALLQVAVRSAQVLAAPSSAQVDGQLAAGMGHGGCHQQTLAAHAW